MKKIFTLIATALMTMGASAQDYVIDGSNSTLETSTVTMTDPFSGAEVVNPHSATQGEVVMYLLKDGKTLSGGNTCTFEGASVKPIKLSNGAPNAIVLPDGVTINKIEFIGYCNSANETSWISNLGVMKDGTYTDLYTCDGTVDNVTYLSKDDCTGGAELQTITINNISASGTIYFKNGGKQPAFIIRLYKGEGGDVNDAPSATAAGLYRTVLDKDYYSEHKIATAFGVAIEPIMGATTKDVDFDNDENYGTSTEVARFHGTPIELENGTGRIFPITELTARDENSYYGFKMTIPEGKAVNIDRLLGQAFCGNAYSWAITISQNGNVLYDTENLKCNGYNQLYCYMDSVNVTATSASGLSDAAKERTNVTPFGDSTMAEESVMNWVGWKIGNFLPTTVQNLSGEVEVKMYYFNKVKKVFSVGNLYVELSEGTPTGISSAITETTVKNSAIYNLAGQRVSAPVKGQIYIQNGKKFIQK